MDRLQLLLHEGGRQWVLQWLPKSRYRMTFPVQNYNNMNMFLIWFGFRHKKKTLADKLARCKRSTDFLVAAQIKK
jgi:hypothetical protein